MKISIIGTGYVGLVTGACFAESGIDVLSMDSDEDRISRLKRGVMPIFEPGLEEIIKNSYCSTKRLNFTTNIKEAVEYAEVLLLAVNTPTLEDNTCDLRNVLSAARDIATNMESYKLIVTKSTVPVGTGRLIKDEVKGILSQRKVSIDFDVVSNPEFLREGNAVKDFIKPDRIVIGTESEKAAAIMKTVYKAQIMLGTPVITTSIETAEMVKYASNTFLAVKIGFINEIANLCELCGADVTVISRAMGMDDRIGPKFLNPGPGYGGSCLPKDTKALIGTGKLLGYIPEIIESAVEVNSRRSRLMLEKIKKAIGSLENKKITILGLAFKPGTDDIREAPSIAIIKELLKAGAIIKAADPQAVNNTKRLHPELEIKYCDDVYTACEDSDCIVLVTEWEQYRGLDFSRLKSVVKQPAFLDLRNVYEPSYIRSFGFTYQGVGRV